MRKILVVAKREYLATVRSKAFIISIVLMPILMGGGMFAQRLLRGVVDTADKRIVVVDRTGKLLPRLIESAQKHNTSSEVFDPETHKQIGAKYIIEPGPDHDLNDEERLALSQRVKDRKIFAFVEIPANVVQPSKNAFDFIKKKIKASIESAAKGGPGADQIDLCSENATQFELTRWLQRELNNLISAERLKTAKVNPELVTFATLGVDVESMGLYTRSPDGQIKKAEATNREAAIFVPMVIMMLMFMVIMVAAQPLMTSVLEEKSLRIAEVLLGSASPFQIMMGKLIGNVGVSLTMITVYMAGGVFLLRYYEMPNLITRDIIIWFVIYQILAIFIYGSVFIAIGAACSDIKEAQSYLTPVMLTLVFPMMVWFQVLREPMGKFATWISLFPPCTPMLMVMRMAATKTLPIWQPLVGVALVVLAVIACVFAAGRIFRIGLLAQGKAPKPAELMRWIISG